MIILAKVTMMIVTMITIKIVKTRRRSWKKLKQQVEEQ